MHVHAKLLLLITLITNIFIRNGKVHNKSGSGITFGLVFENRIDCINCIRI